MADKNPFEIRLEVLQMAKSYLDKVAEVNQDFAFQAFETLVKSGKYTTDQWSEFMPKQYTTEDLMAKAAELYSFVTNKK